MEIANRIPPFIPVLGVSGAGAAAGVAAGAAAGVAALDISDDLLWKNRWIKCFGSPIRRDGRKVLSKGKEG